jgi:phospholipase/carboxylesterase
MENTHLELPLLNLVKHDSSNESNSPCIFFLHGYGSNMEDLFGLSSFFPKHWTCISLQATIPIQYNGWAWADINFEEILKVQNPEQIKQHSKKIFNSIDLCVEKLNIDTEQIYLLGFSQGAALSLYSGLINPSKFKAIIALAGCLSTKEFKSEVNREEVRNLNIFMGNGKQDEVITLPLAHQTKKELSELAVNLNYNEYNAAHTISNDCLNDLLSWIKQLS